MTWERSAFNQVRELRLPDWQLLPRHASLANLHRGGYYVVPNSSANEGRYKGRVVKRHA